MLLLLSAFGCVSEPHDCPTDHEWDGARCASTDTGGAGAPDETGDPPEAEEALCNDDGDDDNDGAADVDDPDCRGRVLGTHLLTAPTYLSQELLAGTEGHFLAYLMTHGRPSWDGEPIVGAADDLGNLISFGPDGAVAIPNLLDGRSDRLTAAEGRGTSFTAYLMVDLSEDLIDSSGGVAAADGEAVIRHPSAAGARLLGKHPFGGLGQADGVATMDDGSVCVAGGVQRYRVDTAGTLAYDGSEEVSATFLTWLAPDGSGPAWTVGLGGAERYPDRVAAAALGDRCVVAFSWEGPPTGRLHEEMGGAEEGLIIAAFDAQGEYEVLAAVDGYGPDVKGWGRSDDGAVWFDVQGAGSEVRGSADPFSRALLSFDAQGTPEPWLGFDDLGGIKELVRIGSGDLLMVTIGDTELVLGASGTILVDGKIAVTRVTSAGPQWVSYLDPDTSFGLEPRAVLADDGSLWLASVLGRSDARVGVDTPEETVLAASRDRESIAVVRLVP